MRFRRRTSNWHRDVDHYTEKSINITAPCSDTSLKSKNITVDLNGILSNYGAMLKGYTWNITSAKSGRRIHLFDNIQETGHHVSCETSKSVMASLFEIVERASNKMNHFDWKPLVVRQPLPHHPEAFLVEFVEKSMDYVCQMRLGNKQNYSLNINSSTTSQMFKSKVTLFPEDPLISENIFLLKDHTESMKWKVLEMTNKINCCETPKLPPKISTHISLEYNGNLDTTKSTRMLSVVASQRMEHLKIFEYQQSFNKAQSKSISIGSKKRVKQLLKNDIDPLNLHAESTENKFWWSHQLIGLCLPSVFTPPLYVEHDNLSMHHLLIPPLELDQHDDNSNKEPEKVLRQSVLLGCAQVSNILSVNKSREQRLNSYQLNIPPPRNRNFHIKANSSEELFCEEGDISLQKPSLWGTCTLDSISFPPFISPQQPQLRRCSNDIINKSQGIVALTKSLSSGMDNKLNQLLNERFIEKQNKKSFKNNSSQLVKLSIRKNVKDINKFNIQTKAKLKNQEMKLSLLQKIPKSSIVSFESREQPSLLFDKTPSSDNSEKSKIDEVVENNAEIVSVVAPKRNISSENENTDISESIISTGSIMHGKDNSTISKPFQSHKKLKVSAPIVSNIPCVANPSRLEVDGKCEQKEQRLFETPVDDFVEADEMKYCAEAGHVSASVSFGVDSNQYQEVKIQDIDSFSNTNEESASEVLKRSLKDEFEVTEENSDDWLISEASNVEDYLLTHGSSFARGRNKRRACSASIDNPCDIIDTTLTKRLCEPKTSSQVSPSDKVHCVDDSKDTESIPTSSSHSILINSNFVEKSKHCTEIMNDVKKQGILFEDVEMGDVMNCIDFVVGENSGVSVVSPYDIDEIGKVRSFTRVLINASLSFDAIWIIIDMGCPPEVQASQCNDDGGIEGPRIKSIRGASSSSSVSSKVLNQAGLPNESLSDNIAQFARSVWHFPCPILIRYAWNSNNVGEIIEEATCDASEKATQSDQNIDMISRSHLIRGGPSGIGSSQADLLFLSSMSSFNCFSCLIILDSLQGDLSSLFKLEYIDLDQLVPKTISRLKLRALYDFIHLEPFPSQEDFDITGIEGNIDYNTNENVVENVEYNNENVEAKRYDMEHRTSRGFGEEDEFNHHNGGSNQTQYSDYTQLQEGSPLENFNLYPDDQYLYNQGTNGQGGYQQDFKHHEQAERTGDFYARNLYEDLTNQQFHQSSNQQLNQQHYEYDRIPNNDIEHQESSYHFQPYSGNDHHRRSIIEIDQDNSPNYFNSHDNNSNLFNQGYNDNGYSSNEQSYVYPYTNDNYHPHFYDKNQSKPEPSNMNMELANGCRSEANEPTGPRNRGSREKLGFKFDSNKRSGQTKLFWAAK